jgi:hypothetical protein
VEVAAMTDQDFFDALVKVIAEMTRRCVVCELGGVPLDRLDQYLDSLLWELLHVDEALRPLLHRQFVLSREIKRCQERIDSSRGGRHGPFPF